MTSLGHLVNVVIVTNIGENPIPVSLSSICSLTMLYLGVNWLGLYTKVAVQVAQALQNPCTWVPPVVFEIFYGGTQVPLHVPGPRTQVPPGTSQTHL